MGSWNWPELTIIYHPGILLKLQAFSSLQSFKIVTSDRFCQYNFCLGEGKEFWCFWFHLLPRILCQSLLLDATCTVNSLLCGTLMDMVVYFFDTLFNSVSQDFCIYAHRGCWSVASFFPVISLSGFGFRLTLAWWSEWGRVSFLFLRKNLWRTGIDPSFKLGRIHSESFWVGTFLCGNGLTTN